MKRYLADVLTALRFIAAVVLAVLIWARKPAEWAFWTFSIGELTDAFDGIAARKWPFPAGKEPKYRQYAELYDMVIDMVLGIVAIIYIICCVDFASGMMVAILTIGLGTLTECIIWGFPFGAPERCTKKCLFRRNPQLAESLVLARRRIYLVAMGGIGIIMLFAAEYPMMFKVGLLGLAVLAGGILLIVKRDRLSEIKTK